jgi:hypothetical protein
MVILNSFQKWWYLWTLPGRKQCTRSSSFPSTITIINFKPLSLTVLEFWKRYHQKTSFRWFSGAERGFKNCLMWSSVFQCHNYQPFLHYFREMSCSRIFWGILVSWVIPEISALSLFELQNLHIKNEKNKLWIWIPCETGMKHLMCLLSHQKISSYQAPQNKLNEVSWL